MISMCSFSLYLDIILFNNVNWWSKYILLNNTESTMLFAYICILIFEDFIFFLKYILYGCFLVTNNQVSFIMIFLLFVSCVAYLVFYCVMLIGINDKFFVG